MGRGNKRGRARRGARASPFWGLSCLSHPKLGIFWGERGENPSRPCTTSGGWDRVRCTCDLVRGPSPGADPKTPGNCCLSLQGTTSTITPSLRFPEHLRAVTGGFGLVWGIFKHFHIGTLLVHGSSPSPMDEVGQSGSGHGGHQKHRDKSPSAKNHPGPHIPHPESCGNSPRPPRDPRPRHK